MSPFLNVTSHLCLIRFIVYRLCYIYSICATYYLTSNYMHLIASHVKKRCHGLSANYQRITLILLLLEELVNISKFIPFWMADAHGNIQRDATLISVGE